MKSIKRTFILVICLNLLLSCSMIVSTISAMDSVIEPTNLELEIDNNHIFSEKINEDAEFTDDCILVYLKHEYGTINVKIEKDFFPEIKDNIESIEDLFYFDKPETIEFDSDYFDRYRQILCVHLRDCGRENVISSIEALDGRKDIDDVEPNYIIRMRAETTPTSDYYEYSENNTAYDKINLSGAWNYTTGSSNVKVAVIDSGVLHHNDLDDNIINNNSGYGGYNTGGGSTIPSGNNICIHGTKVAGLIGSIANSVGIPGVNWNVTIVPVLMGDWYYENSKWYYNADSYDFARVFNFLNNNNIQIANLSLSTANDLPVKIVNNYRGLLIAAAGNDGVNVDAVSGTYNPAQLTSPNLIVVGATNNSDQKRASSNYGQLSVDLFAPGEGLYSTVNNNTHLPDSGTSLSTPLVTGVAALVKAYRPSLGAMDIKRLILENVDIISGLNGKCVTGGRLNAYKTLQAASLLEEHQSYRFSGKTSADNYDDLVEVRRVGDKYEILTYLSQTDGSFANYTTSVSSNGEIKFFRTVTDFNYNPNYEVIVLNGDFNGDSYIDIAFVYARESTSYRSITIHYGNKTNSSYGSSSGGRFAESLTFNFSNSHNLSLYPSLFLVGKCTQQSGAKDSIVVMYKNGQGKRAIITYSNMYSANVTPTLHTTTTTRTYIASDPVFVGDFNGDNKLDILIHWSYNDKRVLTTLNGDGSGCFAQTGTDAYTTNSTNAAYKSKYSIADVNNDGYDDFVVLYKSAENTLDQLVYLGSGSGISSSGVRSNSGVAYREVLSYFVGKVNNDSYVDLVCEYANSSGYRCFTAFYSSTSIAGKFSSNGTYTTSNNANSSLYDTFIIKGDYNSDNCMDLLAVWTGKTWSNKYTNFIHYSSRGSSITSSSLTPYITKWADLFSTPFYSYY